MALNEKIKGITVDIGGSTSGLDSALRDIKKEAGTVQSELGKINKLLKFDPGNSDIQVQAMDRLAKAVAIAQERVDALKEAQSKVREMFAEGKIDRNQYYKFQREVVAAEQALSKAESAQRDFTEQLHNAENGADNAKDEIRHLGNEVRESGDKADKAKGIWSKVGDVLGGVAKTIGKALAGIGAAMGTAGIAAFDAGMKFESAFAGVKKTVDASDEQLSDLKGGIRNMAKELPASTTEISAVAEAAGQLGIDTDSILDFTRTMIDMGESTNLSADEAATALAKLANITQMNPGDYSNLGSTVVALGNTFATTEKDIVEMTTRLASTGSVVGLSEAQMMAVATALSSVGIEAEAGGSAVSKLMKNMEVAVQTYSTAQEVIDSTGYSLRELELMSANNGKDFKALADGIGLTATELNRHIKNAKSLDQYAGIAGQSADAFIQAWGTDAVVALDGFIAGLGNMDESGKSSVEILQEMGLTEVRLSNSILALSESGGILTEAVNTANQAWEDNTALTTEAEQRYGTMESMLGILKNTATDLGVTLYDSMREPVTGAVDFAIEQMNVLATAFATDGLEGLLAALGTVMDSVVEVISDNAEPVINAAMDILFSLVDTILNNLPKLTEVASAIILTLVKKIIEYLPELVTAAIEIIVTLANDIGDALPELIPAIVDAVLAIVQALIDNVDLLIDGAITLILGLAAGLIDSIPLLLERVPEIVAALVMALIENTGKLWSAGYELLLSVVGGIVGAIPKLLTMAADIGEQLGKKMLEFDWAGLGKQMLDGIINGLKNFGTSAWNGIKQAGANLVDGFKSIFGIHSPSRVFADVIGKNMAAGIGVGFENQMAKVRRDMVDSVAVSLDTDFSAKVKPVISGRFDGYSYADNSMNITMPILLDGRPIAKSTSKLQRDMQTGRWRAVGIGV